MHGFGVSWETLGFAKACRLHPRRQPAKQTCFDLAPRCFFLRRARGPSDTLPNSAAVSASRSQILDQGANRLIDRYLTPNPGCQTRLIEFVHKPHAALASRIRANNCWQKPGWKLCSGSFGSPSVRFRGG